MTARQISFLFLSLIVLVIFPQVFFGQTSAAGIPAFGSLQTGSFDSVNLQNLTVSFAVPIVSHPGRGLNFEYNEIYNSLVLTKGVNSSGVSPAWVLAPAQGWSTSGPLGSVTSQKVAPCPLEGITGSQNYVYTDASGSAHPFAVQTFPSNNCGAITITSGYATDASGYFIDLTRGIVLAPDGTEFNLAEKNNLDANGNLISITNGFIADPNGNQITSVANLVADETEWTDTLGQLVLKFAQIPNSPTFDLGYSRLAVDGTYQTIVQKKSFFNVQTAFGCTGVTEFSNSHITLISEFDLPNGQKYSFSYEPTPGVPGAVTGRIQQVILPTGGTITYTYPGANDGINCADGTPLQLTRTINDGTNLSAWTYSRTISGKGGTTAITAPKLPYDASANNTVLEFDPASGLETSRKIYQGPVSGTPLRTVNTAWSHASNGLNFTPMSQVTILEDGIIQSEVETTYDTNGLLQISKEHDWGADGPGPILRTTTLTYLSGTVYSAQNIINRIASKTVADSNGVKYLKVTNYDESGFVNSVCVTGASQHDDTNYGCSYTARGLPTSVIMYTDALTPSGGITGNLNYDSVGNLISTKVNGVLQQQINFSNATQYAFPDSVVRGTTAGPQLSTSATYNVSTGQVATSTDENQQITRFTYSDIGHLDRLTDVQRPDGAHTASSYDDIHNKVTVSSPLQGVNSVQKVISFDPMGRAATVSIEDANSNIFSISATQYDVLGRPYMSSNPYITTPQFWTTNQFDALGRSTIIQLPDGSQTVSSYSANSATTADPASKQRRLLIDGLGRVEETDEPGGSGAGEQASGSITIAGNLGSKSGIGAASGSGSVTISGSEGSKTICVVHTCNTTFDSGSVLVTVEATSGNVSARSSFGEGSHASTIARDIATQLSANSAIRNATVTDNSPTSSTITITASAVGSSTNYAYITNSTSTKDFTSTTNGANFTGGSDGQTVSDSGTIKISIGSFITTPVCYGPTCNNTPAAIATALAGALGNAGSPVGNVQVSGSTISMTANQFSSAWNGTITATPTSSDPADFPAGSFGSQGSLQGGQDPFSSGLAHPYSTFYSYGVLDNLLQVTQGAQTRTYAYDGMGRLTDSTTPEAGHVGFQYNALNQVSQQTDARGVKANYSYDTLNRLQQLSYDVGTSGIPATPTVTYNYGTSPTQNNNGRLQSVLDGLGSETYTYDQLGRTTQVQKAINGITYTLGYGYNLAGEVTSITYPSGRVVQQSFDGIGRLCEIAPQTTGCGTAITSYATGYTYNIASEPTGVNFGNGVAATFGYSPDRLQMTSLGYVKGTQTLFGLNYFYEQDSTNCATGLTGNNGQIQCIKDLVDTGRSSAYTYDTLGRLSNAVTTGSTNFPAWNLSFTYDRYGNRTAQNSSTVTIDPTTNRISTVPYDASGNLLNDGINALAYDAAGRIISNTQSGAASTYGYDCKGLRVQKVSSGATTVYIFSGGKVIAEYMNGAAATAPTREYVYSGSVLLAKIEGGVTSYNLMDHLSTRMITDASGASIGQQGHFPFGDPWYDTLSANKWKFTSYERDGESQNDYAMARIYVNRNGRFTSPDPLSGSLGNPQSLNRYAYGIGDPVNGIDPSGQATYPFERGIQGLFISQAELAGDYGNCKMDGADAPCSMVNSLIGNEWNRLQLQLNHNWTNRLVLSQSWSVIVGSSQPGSDEVNGSRIEGASYESVPFPADWGTLRAPDYYTLGGSVFIWSPNIIYVPKSHTFYTTLLSGGTPGLGAYFNFGRIQDPNVDPDSFVVGRGGSACFHDIVGGCLTFSPVNGKLESASEGGVGTPGAGISGGVTHTVRDTWNFIKAGSQIISACFGTFKPCFP